MPVTIRWSFFLTAFLVALPLRSVLSIASGVVALLAAVVVHEGGHALLARQHGQRPEITLHAMGGATRWTWTREVEPGDRLLIHLAGPLAGILVGGALWCIGSVLPAGAAALIPEVVRQFVWASLGWGLFTLLPVLPMDGGQVMVESLEQAKGEREGRVAAHLVSFGAAVVGFVLGLVVLRLWLVLLFGLFAYDNLLRIRGGRGLDLVS